MKTIAQVRAAFWADHPQFQSEYKPRQRQNDYHVDIRCAFCDWLDQQHRAGLISDDMADRATL